MSLTTEQFNALTPGTLVWVKTGVFTASRARVVGTSGNRATRSVQVDIIDRAPDQPATTDDGGLINNGRGLGFGLKNISLMTEES